MKYFNTMTINTLEDLKKQYRELALIHHPDCGGTTEAMQTVNSEYENLFERYKNIHTNAKGETYTKETEETANDFMDVIQKLVTMKDVVIEIIGCFIWLSGNTKYYKEQIKGLGFKWHSTKSMWYKSPAWYRKYNSNNYSIDEIRFMFGSKTVENEETNKIA